jgi:hypothetical protein
VIWFFEGEWEKWDKRIEADSESGRLDVLIEETFEEKEKGALRELWNASHDKPLPEVF